MLAGKEDGVWFWVSLSFLAIRVFGEKRGEGEKKCRGPIILYNFASASFGLLAYMYVCIERCNTYVYIYLPFKLDQYIHRRKIILVGGLGERLISY